jgi:hypothetical protein
MIDFSGIVHIQTTGFHGFIENFLNVGGKEFQKVEQGYLFKKEEKINIPKIIALAFFFILTIPALIALAICRAGLDKNPICKKIDGGRELDLDGVSFPGQGRIELEAPTKTGGNAPSYGVRIGQGDGLVVADLNYSSTSNLKKTAEKLLAGYNSGVEGWLFVPPKNIIDRDEDIIAKAGGVSFEGEGRWKIHVSIDPTKMEQAIPILVEILHSEDAPLLGFKMQSKANLDGVHQIGKELAIIFNEESENGDLKDIKKCLTTLAKRLNSASIKPENGVVLTAKTVDIISKAAEDKQIMEKENLERGKFDRQIAASEELAYFHYRDEGCIPMLDNEIRDLRGIPGIFSRSDIMTLVEKNPDYAHNPNRAKDPFLKLEIK